MTGRFFFIIIVMPVSQKRIVKTKLVKIKVNRDSNLHLRVFLDCILTYIKPDSKNAEEKQKTKRQTTEIPSWFNINQGCGSGGKGGGETMFNWHAASQSRHVQASAPG